MDSRNIQESKELDKSINVWKKGEKEIKDSGFQNEWEGKLEATGNNRNTSKDASLEIKLMW